MSFTEAVIESLQELYVIAPILLVVGVCVKAGFMDARIEELERKIKELESK